MLHVIIWMTAVKVGMWNGNRILYKVYSNGIQSSVSRRCTIFNTIIIRPPKSWWPSASPACHHCCYIIVLKFFSRCLMTKHTHTYTAAGRQSLQSLGSVTDMRYLNNQRWSSRLVVSIVAVQQRSNSCRAVISRGGRAGNYRPCGCPIDTLRPVGHAAASAGLQVIEVMYGNADFDAMSASIVL